MNRRRFALKTFAPEQELKTRDSQSNCDAIKQEVWKTTQESNPKGHRQQRDTDRKGHRLPM